MKYLVHSCMGTYYISEDDPKIIEKPCHKCGDSNTIILPFEGSLISALNKYFSVPLVTDEEIRFMMNSAFLVNEIIEDIEFEYEANIDMLSILLGRNIITEEESKQLLKKVLQTKKKNISLYKTMKSNKVKQKKYTK